MNNKKRLGFIGAGSMAEALIKGIVQSGTIEAGNIYISDIKKSRLRELKKDYSLKTTEDNYELVKNVDYIILAVKPTVVPKVLEEVDSYMTSSQTIISIAAGVTINMISDLLSKELPIIRLMPNTPALIGEGAIAYSTGELVSQEDIKLVEEFLTPLGRVVGLKEEMMDAVTGLSGSGPAYIYLIIEALSDAGVNVGLDRESALKLATQTVIGAAKMVEKTGQHPSQLKDMVTSPGGTTITGLKELEKGGVRAAIYQAVEEATIKSRKLKGEE